MHDFCPRINYRLYWYTTQELDMFLPPGDEAVYQQQPLIMILNKEKLENKIKKTKAAQLDTLKLG